MAEKLLSNGKLLKRKIICGIFLVNSIFIVLLMVWTFEYYSKANKFLSSFDFDSQLTRFMNTGDRIALILDFDGVLAPITDTPSATEIDPKLECLLNELATNSNISIAILSGRGIDDLKERIHIHSGNITFGGNHGLEIEFYDGHNYEYFISDNVQKNFTNLIGFLEQTWCNGGAYVENKRRSLTYHYPKKWTDVNYINAEVSKIIKNHGFVPIIGHYAIEALPPVQWTKGDAALYMLYYQYGNKWMDKVKVIFIGDSDSDENAMKALKGTGLSFRISKNTSISTWADYIFRYRFQVAALFEWIKKITRTI